MTTLATGLSTQYSLIGALDRATPSQLQAAGEVAAKFLSTAVTSTGRATFYNSKEEQEKAEAELHDAALATHPSLYACLLAFPGVLDRARVEGLRRLTRGSVQLDAVGRQVPLFLAKCLPAPRLLRAFNHIRDDRTNNSATRRLILNTLLNPDKIELWAVKYRKKMRRALEHAIGKRRCGILKSILAKTEPVGTATGPTPRDAEVMSQFLGIRAHSFTQEEVVATARTLDALAFVLGTGRSSEASPLLQSFEAAKTDLTKGRGLPPEVLEGIRSTYHPNVPKEEILKLTKDTMTKTQRMQVQKRASKAGVKVEWDPNQHDAVKLYIYAFEQDGVTEEIRQALVRKAGEVGLPPLGNVGIIIDTSRSMFGHGTQKLRPMATALAVRDVLAAASDGGYVCGTDGIQRSINPLDLPTDLLYPTDATNLAQPLVVALRCGVDSVFVITDGYENRAAGRFAEVVEKVRGLGINTPIFQINPVFASEAAQARELAPGHVTVLPVADPKSLASGLLMPLLRENPKQGIQALQDRVVRLLATGG